MTESLIGRISEMLRHRQSVVASDTQARVSSLVDRIAATSGVTLAPSAAATANCGDTGQIVGALAAALNVASGTHPALVPQWEQVAAEAAHILLQAGWCEVDGDDELPFRAAQAMRSVDRETTAAVRQHIPSFKSATDFNIENTRKWGPFKDDKPWTSSRFFAHTAGAARAMIGEKQLSSSIRTLVFAADLGRTDASACSKLVLDARFESLFYKVECQKQGAALSLDCVTPRGGRDGLAISLFIRVRDDAWLKRAQEADISLGNCQIEVTLEEAMY